MKRISAAKCIFLAAIAVIAVVVIVCSASRTAVAVYERLTTFQTGVGFGEERHDNWLSLRLGPNDTYRVEFLLNDKPSGSFVVDSGGWANKVDAEGLKPIIHLIPKHIVKKGFTSVFLRALRGDGDYIVSDIATFTGEAVPQNAAAYNLIDFEIKQLEIEIQSGHMAGMEEKRREALGLGILLTGEKDKVPAEIRAENERSRAEVRLKGDWTDHLAGDKWSLRIEIKGDNCIYGMQKFSVQSPATRNFLAEPVLYRLYREQGGVALRYDFTDVYINGKYMGVYALEEFMEKRVIEHAGKREGPILHMDETTLVWEPRAYHAMPFILQNTWFQPFSEKKIVQSATLSDNASYAVDSLSLVYSGIAPADNIFDLDLCSKLAVIRDLFSAMHGRVDHNSRFYYNPVTSLLEPIAFDELAFPGRPDGFIWDGIEGNVWLRILQRLFESDRFRALYRINLEKTARDLPGFQERAAELIARQTLILRRENPDFSQSISGISERCEALRAVVDEKNPLEADISEFVGGRGKVRIVSSNRAPVIFMGLFAGGKRVDDGLETPPWILRDKPGQIAFHVPEEALSDKKIYLKYRYFFADPDDETVIPLAGDVPPAPVDIPPAVEPAEGNDVARKKDASDGRGRVGHYAITGVVGFFMGAERGRITIAARNIGELAGEVVGLSDGEGNRIADFPSGSILRPRPAGGGETPAPEIILEAVCVDPEISYEINNLYLNYNYISPDAGHAVEAKPSKIVPFKPHNEELRRATQIRTQDNLNEFDVIETDGDQVRFKGDLIKLNRMLFIPPGRKFVLRAGQTVDLADGASIVSRSPVEINGTEEAPVKIISGNGTGHALVVLRAGGRSKIDYLVCDNLGEVHNGAWRLTGGVTFYESDADFDHCLFLNARSEDGLNLIRTDFTVRNSIFSGTFQDAFDADFSTGILENCRFEHAGNDALDVSSSEIHIRNVTFRDIHDKGISIGEASKAYIEDVHVDTAQAVIGVKDNSTVSAKNIHGRNVLFGYIAYQKKPEFGHSRAEINNFRLEMPYDFDYLIENGEALVIDGKLRLPRAKKKEAVLVRKIIAEEPIR
jgi:hypothetical protein